MRLDRTTLFEQCRDLLGVTQEELGKSLGVSRRTAQRWASDGIPTKEMTELARLVHPRDPALAAEIVGALGTTLEAKGIVRPMLAPPPAPIVDAVVCAAAEAMDLMPKQVRPGLLAAFARAKEIGLSIDVIEQTLRASLRNGANAGTEVPAADPKEAHAPKRKRHRK